MRVVAGRTAGVLLPNPPEFRWMAAGAESPWLPGTTIHRQGSDADWGRALADLARELEADGG